MSEAECKQCDRSLDPPPEDADPDLVKDGYCSHSCKDNYQDALWGCPCCSYDYGFTDDEESDESA